MMKYKGSFGVEPSKQYYKIKSEVLETLYEMNEYIQDREVMPEKLIDQAIFLMDKIARCPDTDPGINKAIVFYIDIIVSQIEINNILKEQAEILQAQQEYKEAEEKLNKIIRRALPDQQTTLGHA